VSGMITAEYDGKGTVRFIVASKRLAGGAALRVMRESLTAAGLKTRTQVRRALKEQMGTRTAKAITAHTRSYSHEGGLAYSIEGNGKGLPIREFPVKVSRSKKIAARWSPRDHWRVQTRDGSGRFGSIVDPGGAGVSASPWGRSRAFERSFAHPTKGPVMIRVAGKRAVRKLFGPSVAKEIDQGQSLVAFEATGIRELARLLPEKIDRLIG
jgi:hypothetical protein